jgi:hypothetical protein
MYEFFGGEFLIAGETNAGCFFGNRRKTEDPETPAPIEDSPAVRFAKVNLIHIDLPRLTTTEDDKEE